MRLAAFLFALCSTTFGETLTFWIEPCVPSISGCEIGDEELARWALNAWQGETGGGVTAAPASKEAARIKIFWASGREGLYGEARGILVDGKPGAEIHIRPSLEGLGPDVSALGKRDPLFRQTVVYLTCVHELGHALRLPHTREYADIMYNFAYGGDILEYFNRYRRKLKTRSDIPANRGLSEEDARRIRLVYSNTK